MRKEHHHDPQLSLDAGYEVSDINFSIIIKCAIALALVIFFSVLIVIGIIKAMNRRAPMNPAEGSPLAAELRVAPAGPLLQTDPVGDKQEIIGAARERLTTFGNIEENPAAKRAHVPIEIAMDLVAEGQVPYRQEPFSARLGESAPASPSVQPGAGIAEPVPPAPDAPAANPARPADPVPAPPVSDADNTTESTGTPAGIVSTP